MGEAGLMTVDLESGYWLAQADRMDVQCKFCYGYLIV